MRKVKWSFPNSNISVVWGWGQGIKYAGGGGANKISVRHTPPPPFVDMSVIIRFIDAFYRLSLELGLRCRNF